MYSRSPSDGPRRATSNYSNKGKGGGKGKGKSKGGRGKGKGERVVSVENHAANRQSRANDRRAEVKHKMLSTVLPKISDLSVVSTDTLFEVLSMGAKLSSADVKKYLSKPTSDRKRLVLVHYKDRWEKDAEFRNTWPADRSELTSALEEWASDQFAKRTTTQIDSSPLRPKQSGGRLGTHSTPVDGGQGGRDHSSRGGGKVLTPQAWDRTRSNTSGLNPQDQPSQRNRVNPDSNSGKRDSGGAKRAVSSHREPSARNMPSCVTLPPPTRSAAASRQSAAVLLPAPPKTTRLIGEGTLSMVIPKEVIAAVEETVVRVNGEASKGPAKCLDLTCSCGSKSCAALPSLQMCIRQAMMPEFQRMRG